MASWLRALRNWRDQRALASRPIPDDLWALTLARFPFLQQPDPADAKRLRELSTLFLARKEFHGTRGFVVSDEIAVAIAAQACLPVLHLGLSWYDGFLGIVVHDGEVVAAREEMDEDGVVHEYDEELLGEMVPGGPVTLCWRGDSELDPALAEEWVLNVVIHEFAHVLDDSNGQLDGMPLIEDRAMHDEWGDAFEAAYEAFCGDVDAERATVLDPYGADHPSEFFAVACETFFVAPHDLRAEHREVYRLLSRFFRQDPARIT